MSGLLFGLATVVVATVFGLLWRRQQGRVRQDHPATALPDAILREVDGVATVTLVQISNYPICARCPQARAMLTEFAAATPGVRHAELDLAEHPELADQLRVRSTPTTVALSRTGHELFRIRGVPHRAELLGALAPHLENRSAGAGSTGAGSTE